MILVDTHVLIWMDTGDRRLGRTSRELIESNWATGSVGASALTFWEIGLLCERGRFRPARPLTEWRNTWLVAGLVEMPLDGVIATRALDLSDLSQDPADRFIAATAIIVGATLLTADALMLEWRHPLPRHDART